MWCRAPPLVGAAGAPEQGLDLYLGRRPDLGPGLLALLHIPLGSAHLSSGPGAGPGAVAWGPPLPVASAAPWQGALGLRKRRRQQWEQPCQPSCVQHHSSGRTHPEPPSLWGLSRPECSTGQSTPPAQLLTRSLWGGWVHSTCSFQHMVLQAALLQSLEQEVSSIARWAGNAQGPGLRTQPRPRSLTSPSCQAWPGVPTLWGT